MKQYKSQSSIPPQERDTTSSETTVYLNTNIVEIPATKDSPLMYNYDVAEYTKGEYEKKLDKDRIVELEGIVVGLLTIKPTKTTEDIAFIEKYQAIKEPVEPIKEAIK